MGVYSGSQRFVNEDSQENPQFQIIFIDDILECWAQVTMAWKKPFRNIVCSRIVLLGATADYTVKKRQGADLE